MYRWTWWCGMQCCKNHGRVHFNEQTNGRSANRPDTPEPRESIPADNKQACPCVSHLVLTNNCGTLAKFLFARARACTSRQSACRIQRIQLTERASRTRCSADLAIVLQIITPVDINDTDRRFQFRDRALLFVPLSHANKGKCIRSDKAATRCCLTWNYTNVNNNARW